MPTALELIIDTVRSSLASQMPDGAFPGGNNGPHRHPETPVRNTCHTLFSLARLHSFGLDGPWESAAEKALGYLLESDEARPHGFSYHHRDGHIDHCNGVIGPAWSIEALAVAGRQFHEPAAVERAQEIFDTLLYRPEWGLWHPVEIDGVVRPLDRTFNHQLWLAAAAVTLGSIEAIAAARRFIDVLPGPVVIMNDGLVYHPVREPFGIGDGPQDWRAHLRHRARRLAVRTVRACQFRGRSKDLLYRSLGYHQFNLYAFAVLRESISGHPWWSAEAFRRSVRYSLTDRYLEALLANQYAYPYNAPGFELPYSWAVLGDLAGLERDSWRQMSERVIRTQLELTFDPRSFSFSRNNPDGLTLTARIYELTRMSREQLESIQVPGRLTGTDLWTGDH